MNPGSALQIIGRLVWLIHFLTVIACLALDPSGLQSGLLLIGWLASAVAAICFSGGYRKRSIVVIVLSAFLVRNTILDLMLTIACLRGDCI